MNTSAFLQPVFLPFKAISNVHLRRCISSPNRISTSPSYTNRVAIQFLAKQEAPTPHKDTDSLSNILGDKIENETKSALLVVDHGSKRQAANDMLLEIGKMIRQKTSIPVYTAHMEIASPTIEDGMRSCYEDGATHVIVVPFFLSPGRHSTEDIPNLASEAGSKFDGLTYEVRPPIGTHPRIVEVVMDRAGLL